MFHVTKKAYYPESPTGVDTLSSSGGVSENAAYVSGTFSRQNLEKTFGTGFADQGKTKMGSVERNCVVEFQSPAVKSGLVRLKQDGTIDRRCAACQQELVLLDDDGCILKSSPLLKQQVLLRDDGRVDKTSPAVLSGSVTLTQDGKIDRRCEAAKKGWIQFSSDGEINPRSIFLQPKQLTVHETNASHVNSFEVFNAICEKYSLVIPKSEAADIVKGLNRFDNLVIKSRDGNMYGTQCQLGKGDRSLDNQINESILSEGTIPLSAAAAERARRQINIVLASEDIFPRWVIEKWREVYSGLVDDQGHKICRSNAKIQSVEETESRRSYSVDLGRTETGLKFDGTPDMRTTKGREIAGRAESGLKFDGTPDMRTTKGREIAGRAEYGWKSDGTPDMRTTKGREIAGAEYGWKSDGTPDMRTTKGREIAGRAEYGLKSDGTPDMRTTKGRNLQSEFDQAASVNDSYASSVCNPNKCRGSADENYRTDNDERAKEEEAREQRAGWLRTLAQQVEEEKVREDQAKAERRSSAFSCLTKTQILRKDRTNIPQYSGSASLRGILTGSNSGENHVNSSGNRRYVQSSACSSVSGSAQDYNVSYDDCFSGTPTRNFQDYNVSYGDSFPGVPTHNFQDYSVGYDDVFSGTPTRIHQSSGSANGRTISTGRRGEESFGNNTDVESLSTRASSGNIQDYSVSDNDSSPGVPTGIYRSSGSANGRPLYTGPRGRDYYINKNGNKTYVKR